MIFWHPPPFDWSVRILKLPKTIAHFFHFFLHQNASCCLMIIKKRPILKGWVKVYFWPKTAQKLPKTIAHFVHFFLHQPVSGFLISVFCRICLGDLAKTSKSIEFVMVFFCCKKTTFLFSRPAPAMHTKKNEKKGKIQSVCGINTLRFSVFFPEITKLQNNCIWIDLNTVT